MIMLKYTKNGYYTIEAAIFLPIFLITLITLAYIVRLICIEECMVHVLTDEGRYISTRAYDNRNYAAGLKIRVVHGVHLKERFDSEVKHGTECWITDYQYLIKKDGISGIISYNLAYEHHVNLPLPLFASRIHDKELIFRGFIGADYDQDSFDYEFMEQENESVIVWVFPKAGEKYHAENCRHIKVYPRQVILTKAIANQYKSCSHCNHEKLPLGSIVYTFNGKGGVYHSGSCFIVDRYVVSMDIETAKNKGYTACKTCGGGLNQ